jgi:hypothetical protein
LEGLWKGSRWIHAVVAGVALWFLWLKLGPSIGKIGHDYSYHITRLTIGTFHFWQNGISVPYFTPSLCGGIPFFADPQLVYYSVPQILAFGMDPVVATQIAYMFFYVLAYLGTFAVARRVLHLAPGASHLSALAFILNGFTFGHLYVGHATHHCFLLFPWILYAMFSGGTEAKGRELIKYAALFALVILYFVWSGGAHVIAISIPFFVLVIPWWYYEHRRRNRIKEGIAVLAMATAMVLILSTPKLWAFSVYREHFSLRGIDRPELGAFAQAWRFFFPSHTNTPQFLNFGELDMGSWEFVGFVSRLVIPALVFILITSFTHRPFLMGGLIVVSISVFFLAMGELGNASWPILSAYHMPIKLLAAFIPLFALALGVAFERAKSWHIVAKWTPQIRLGIWIAAGVFLLAEFSIHSRFIQDNPQAASYPKQENYFLAMKHVKKLPAVANIIDQPFTDDVNLLLGRSSLKCYEPIFGYRQEGVKAKLQRGPTETIRDSAFNLTHPGCFLFPDHLKCKAWDRIPASEREQFERFRNGFSVTEWVPWEFRLTVTLAVLGILLLLGWTAWVFSEPLRSILARRRQG